MRHSLLVRLLASSVLVAVCSVTATAWLAVQGTSGAISTEQGETLAVDTRIHDTLLGYAATNAAWDGVDDTVRDLAAETGRRIALTTENRMVIADSAADGTPLPGRTASVVDPLAVDVSLASEGADRIDPRAVGPFELERVERARLNEAARRYAECLRLEFGQNAEVATTPSGRPRVEVDGEATRTFVPECGPVDFQAPTDTEEKALADLNERIAACLRPYGIGEVTYYLDGTWYIDGPLPGFADPGPVPDSAPGPEEAGPRPPDMEWGPAPGGAGTADGGEEADARVAACVDSSRREQLAPYVAPAALLFIDDPHQESPVGPALSREGLLRIGGVVLLVLVLTVGVSVVAATRLIRPVHALTTAVQRMREGEGSARVDVRDNGEIGRLAAAFNEMSAHLERLEEQRKAMVSDVSHELRTPLSNIRGWLEAAQDGVAELDADRMAMLVEETLLLQRIIDDLRDLALADAGKLRLTPEPLRVRDLVDQVVESHRVHAESAGLRIAAEVSDDVEVVADRARLLQALGNLLHNALRHTPAPGRITVRAAREGGDAVIEVADTGVGIPADQLPDVFNRFWRAEKSRNRQTGGSGLGLAIVRNLTELHGGSASVTSTVGEGSTFTVRLPLRRDAVSGGRFRPLP
nr:HAMP domain-containing sensor histidine kinase [Nocardiopsis mwathae]